MTHPKTKLPGNYVALPLTTLHSDQFQKITAEAYRAYWNCWIVAKAFKTSGILTNRSLYAAYTTPEHITELVSVGLLEPIADRWKIVAWDAWSGTNGIYATEQITAEPKSNPVVILDFHHKAFKEIWETWPKHPKGANQQKAFDSFCENVNTQADFDKLKAVGNARVVTWQNSDGPDKDKFTPSFINLCSQYKDIDLPAPTEKFTKQEQMDFVSAQFEKIEVESN
jgi:hypothetical protein